ncbi:MAG: hypothetical protein KatS3mg127_2121 [Silanimonas sp.]|nr:MAG: hypothetical protein KatS3mg127_0926 [Silanimonas sp.]GIX38882.1 MAG: hypothetical protein KatS3mg127_2121 [Silanimonas sp.]
MPTRLVLLPFSSRLHRALVWISLAVLLVWTLSGFLHPLMGLLAPQPAQRSAPPLSVSAPDLHAGLPGVLAKAGESAVLRLVPGPGGALWQATMPSGERRYLRLDGRAWSGDDAAYVRWLAGWYLGEERTIASMRRLDAFTPDYPWVNRLLPVWEVRFAGQAGLTAYLHTETASLASLGDDRRRLLQQGFRALHTLDWLDGERPIARFVLVMAMVALLLTAASGFLLWALRRPAARPTPARRWHRRLALIAGLPLLLMSGSGLVHALWSAGDGAERGLRLPPPRFDVARLSALAAMPLPAWPEVPERLGSASLAASPEGAPWLILRPPLAGGWGAPVPEALVIDLESGQPLANGERQLAEAAARAQGLPEGGGLERVTHFSPGYDFRNRRLPAWLAALPDGQRVALDPDTAQRLDVLSSSARVEAYVFSLAHKWQPLAGLLGSPARRDALQVALLSLGPLLAFLGLRLRRTTRPHSALGPAASPHITPSSPRP